MNLHLIQPRNFARAPFALDYFVFLLVLPAGLGFIMAAFGLRIVAQMPFLAAVGYMTLHIAIAWWGISAACVGVKFWCRHWQPPPATIMLLGFAFSLLPLTYVYVELSAFFERLYPGGFVPVTPVVEPSWTFEYITHFARYSLPALPLFMLAYYSYKFVTGVDWWAYPDEQRAGFSDDDAQNDAPADDSNVPFMRYTTLPSDARILAVEAEEHYIKVWSDAGTDMIRFRFKDAVNELGNDIGMQVHRSWWVNLEAVREVQRRGRSLELTLNDSLNVPVSQSYRNNVIESIEAR